MFNIYYSNHDRGPNSHVIRFLERHGIPYHYLCAKENEREEELLELVQNTDFLVLARYMQVNRIRLYVAQLFSFLVTEQLTVSNSSLGGINISLSSFDATIEWISLLKVRRTFW